MKSINEVRSQVTGLINGIRECNWIPYEDKKDITQNTLLKIIEKFNEGVVIDNAWEIRGYVFQVLRNNCLAYHRDRNKNITTELKWDVAEEKDIDKEELHLELKGILERKIQNNKYKGKKRQLVELVFESVDREEIIRQLELTPQQYKKMRQGLVMMLKADLKRKPKYLIKHIEKEWVQVPCYTSTDVKEFLKHHTTRQVKSIIYDGLISPDGYYVEILNKIVRKRKGSPK